jgi:hypothetical protein
MYEAESDSIKEQILDICYHMRGGIEINSAWGMSFNDREAAIKVINKRIKDQNPNSAEYL